MSKSLASIFSNADALLELSPEELAALILEVLNSMEPEEFRQYATHHNFAMQAVQGYPQERREELKTVLVEGWAWLQRECLIAPRPGTASEWVIVTRKGKQMASKAQLEAYRRANLLAGMLHPRIETESKASFLRGEYETAIFNAFKEVEIAVREAGQFTWKDLGTELMNEAFKVNAGKLSDKTLPETEQIGLRNLFSGAIGYYKNPGSHRHFPTDPVEVAETLFFASLLLRIVERSAAQKKTPP